MPTDILTSALAASCIAAAKRLCGRRAGRARPTGSAAARARLPSPRRARNAVPRCLHAADVAAPRSRTSLPPVPRVVAMGGPIWSAAYRLLHRQEPLLKRGQALDPTERITALPEKVAIPNAPS